MAINIEATIRWRGYNPNDLSPGSSRRVWAVCNGCGKGRWGSYRKYNKKPKCLCRSCSHKGKYPSEETRKKLSVAQMARKSHTFSRGLSGKKSHRYGKHHSQETKIKMRELQKGEKHHFYGKHHSEISRQRLSATHQGIHYDEWESYVTDQKYCPAFNEVCRESNREKYNRKCFICGLPENENRTKTGKIRKLSVHHVDMNKNQGCDGNRWRLIPLCMYHHGVVHYNPWKDRIVYLLNTCWK